MSFLPMWSKMNKENKIYAFMILHNLIAHTVYKQDDLKPEAKGR